MIEHNKCRRYIFIVAASLALQGPACASTQMETGPEHPASPEAHEAPQAPVGGGLSAEQTPGASAASTPAESAPAGEHAHGGASHGDEAAPGTSPTPDPKGAPASDPHASHAPANAASHAQSGGASTSAGDKAAEQWTCPMHPEVLQSQPGKCPKCGMKLVQAAPKP